MTRIRFARLTGTLLIGTIALASCGSDDNTSAADNVSETGSLECPTGTLNAEGSSAQQNAIEQAIDSYGEKCPDATINYNPTGSGAGIKQFLAAQVDFAGSDSALKTQEKDGVVETDAAAKRCANPAWNLPMVAGPIALAYNLPGVDTLVLTPEIAAKVFLGKIKTWDDKEIASANPDVTLPSTPVRVFFRSDESGTTENLARYLSATAGDVWTAEPSKAWPGQSGEGREKSAGVSEGVKSTEGGITYVEWSYARDNNLSSAQIDNGSGPVALTAESASAAVAAASPAGSGNDLRLELDYATKTPGAYPIVLVTYEIVCSKGLDAGKTALLRSFLGHFASPEVQKGLEGIGYAPLPESVRTQVASAVDAVTAS